MIYLSADFKCITMYTWQCWRQRKPKSAEFGFQLTLVLPVVVCHLLKKNQLAIMRSTENKSVSCCLIQLRSVSSYSDMNQHDYKACADKTNSNWQQFMNCFYWPSDYHISTMPYMMHHYIFSHRISKWNGLDWHKNKEVFSEENTCDLLKQANLSKWTDGQTQWWRSDPNVQTCWHTTWC